MLETAFTCLITLQFIVVTLHDLVDVPGWTHTRQVQAAIGRRKLWLVTAINGIFPGIAVAFVIYFWNRPKPLYVVDYWVLYSAVTVVFAVVMWYVPYFFGATEKHKRTYANMYAGTLQILPARNDNPRPNLLHVCFHVLFVVNLALVLLLRFRSG